MRHAAVVYRTVLAILAAVLAGAASSASAQGYGQPLSFQGVDDPVLHSVSARAQGGLSVGRSSDPALMFSNPASMRNLDGLTISVSALNRSISSEQTQQWFPLRNFPTLSLMMEGLLDHVADPDLDTYPPDDGIVGPEDSIPRPFDSIGPDWARSKAKALPLQLTIAAPFEMAGITVHAGLGFIRYADLYHVFQNNNVLDPSIGSQRPAGVPLPGIGQETPVIWSRSLQLREGAIHGYGAALSADITEGLTVGASALLLKGTSDDSEESTVRGRILFGNNNNVYYYRLDSVYAITSSVGTSDYSGFQLSLSCAYQLDVFSLGFQVNPPTTIQRDATMRVAVDTTGTAVVTARSFTEEITLPWRGSAGIALQVRNDLSVGLEYELRPYARTQHAGGSGAAPTPWLSSGVFKAGTAYRPLEWLMVRAGYRTQSYAFEQEGNALVGEPVPFSVYAAGLGFSFMGAQLDISYEYSNRQYQDMWQTNVNLNRSTHHTFSTSISYIIH